MRELAQAYPDADTFLALPPEELGAKLLFLIKQRSGQEHFYPGSFGTEFWDMGVELYPRARRREILVALSEALAWLEAQGLILRDPEQSGEFFLLSRRARSFAIETDVATFATARLLPRSLLHPSIAETVWMAFVRAEYDVAVFQAMKQVEIAVREASRLAATDLGVTLMRKAFDVSSGPLTDRETVRGEQEATSALFAGAIGLFKNPHSHRQVTLTRAEEAIEIILLANHLLRIVDARARPFS